MTGCSQQTVPEKAFIDAVGKRHSLIVIEPIWKDGKYFDGQVDYYDTRGGLYRILKKNSGDKC